MKKKIVHWVRANALHRRAPCPTFSVIGSQSTGRIEPKTNNPRSILILFKLFHRMQKGF